MPELDPEPMWNDIIGRHKHYTICDRNGGCYFQPRGDLNFSTNRDDYFG